MNRQKTAGTIRLLKERNIRRARMRIIKTRLILFMACMLMIMLMAKVVAGKEAVVDANTTPAKLQYKVVEVQSGDSLWKIAKENYSEEFKDIYSYIHEIKECNHIRGNVIFAGHKLTVPYYE